MRNKVKSIEEVEQLVKMHKYDGKIIVTTNGSFDILHCAHVNLLERAKDEGDILVVLMNSDGSIQRYKGLTRPIIPEIERARMVASLECVDYVVIFDEDKPLDYLERIKGHIHVKGGSWDKDRINEEKIFVERWSGIYKTFELEEGFSTTNIINEILSRHSRDYSN
ncbi:D-glycero-beta-D-manno-heptose 1-phosphate adenylyltransferase [Candidatus Pacearchaeota archaeon CG10_big_fil_rev_8_21_14_0_10_32_14]|nr:MAG: D-glycero-beta-D-manno-heptose 1-phosphate adenylyltransferase [Candidatus Pacearchaeota archaeon CG10_big_fil_rev_8_21_14_0_10_32_14]